MLYQGQEYHDLGLEEFGNVDEELFEYLRGSNRSSIKGIPARCQISWNFGGKAHKWLKRRFVDQDLRPEEKKDKYLFIPALLEDNPALMRADPGYGDRILSMSSPSLRKAWRWGDYDIDAGQYFDSMRRNVHMVDDFKIPDHWERFIGYDFGWAHPAAMVWFAVDEQSQLYVYRVWNGSKTTIQGQAEIFHSQPDFKKAKYIWAGHDCWVDRGSAMQTFEKGPAPTVAEQFEEFGVYLTPANISRKQGAQLLREGLSYELGTDDEGDQAIIKEPRILFFKSAKMAYDNLSDRIHNPNDLEDVLKEDYKEGVEGSGDDIYDALRYGYMSRYSASKAPKNSKDKYSQLRNLNNDRPSWRTV